jgi:hypothetical protein
MVGNFDSPYQIRPTVTIRCHPLGFRDCGFYAADVIDQYSKHGLGRKPKDEALVLRDKYWVLRLKAHTLQSYSRLERSLCEGITVGRRSEGQGYSQPFALSKIAAGKRGLSADLDSNPKLVEGASTLWPDSEAVYNSCIWGALSRTACFYKPQDRFVFASPEVLRRLPHRYLVDDPYKRPRFTETGVRRLGRLTHIEALGLLLLNASGHAGWSHQAYVANLCVPAVFARLCKYDESFAAIADGVQSLIKERYEDIPDLCDPEEQKAFGPRFERAWTLMPF